MSESVKTIKASCPTCGDVSLLATDIDLYVCNLPDRSYYEFLCSQCEEVITKQATVEVIDLLKMAGIAPRPWHIPLEAIETHDGPPISYDDILTFALELKRYKNQTNLIIALAVPHKPAY